MLLQQNTDAGQNYIRIHTYNATKMRHLQKQDKALTKKDEALTKTR